jgi:hypothetical protein
VDAGVSLHLHQRCKSSFANIEFYCIIRLLSFSFIFFFIIFFIEPEYLVLEDKFNKKKLDYKRNQFPTHFRNLANAKPHPAIPDCRQQFRELHIFLFNFESVIKYIKIQR